jgi:hypothetical protein
VLAAAVVRALNDENPDIHTVWACDAAARVARIPDGTLEERLDHLRRILEDARDFGGLTGTDEGAFYRLREVGDHASCLPGGRVRRRRHSRCSGPSNRDQER